MNKVIRIALAAAVSAVALPVSTQAATDSVSHQLTIRGHVPVICRLSFEASTANPKRNSVELGNLNEFCNAGTGYVVVAIHDAGVQNASLNIGGLGRKALSETGRTVLFDSAQPGIAQRNIVLHANKGALQHITFAIEPKGSFWY